MPEDTPEPEQELERDREFVGRLVTGEDAAWDEFDARFGPRIRSAVRNAGIDDGNRGEAYSFVTEGLLIDDYRRLRRWNGDVSLSAYLYRVSRNLAIDFRRNLAPRTADDRPRFVFPGEEETLDVPDAGSALVPETRFMQARLREAIVECLFRMPNGSDREMILFHYHLGLSAEEIARLSGRSRNAIDQALHRARRSLAAVAAAIHPELVEYLQEDRHDW
jgi:RNA polymerase sigma-70 factor (ECF subfamily)